MNNTRRFSALCPGRRIRTRRPQATGSASLAICTPVKSSTTTAATRATQQGFDHHPEGA
jgi:hypothetical protein